MTTTRTFTATIVKDGPMCYIPVPFDPKAAFGKLRAPVTVTLNGYTFGSTIAAMGGPVCVPLRKSHREAAGLEGGETLPVTLALDTTPRVIAPPADLLKALKAGGAHAAWQALSFTHQREHVEAIESAKKPETRARRIERAVAMIGGAPADAARRGAAPGTQATSASQARSPGGRPSSSSATSRSGATQAARACASFTTSKL